MRALESYEAVAYLVACSPGLPHQPNLSTFYNYSTI